MKSFWQIGLLIIVLMGLVLGATYLTQYTPRKQEVEVKAPPNSGPDPKAALGPPIRFQYLAAVWDPSILVPLNAEDEKAKYSKQIEVASKNRFDFWFQNAQSMPVQINLNYKSCTCSDVQLYVFPRETWNAWQRHMLLAACLPHGTASILGPGAAAALLQPLANESAWEVMNAGTPELKTIPPAADGVGQPGIMRVNFEPKALSQDATGNRLNLTVHSQTGPGAFDVTKLEIRYEVVPPFGAFPLVIDAGEMGPNDKREFNCFIWSTTRSSLTPKIDLGSGGTEGPIVSDPCIEIGAPILLTKEQLAHLPALLGENYQNMKPICAYVVPVAVHERRGDKQLDLGPISRRLSISVDPALTNARIPITGLVRGEVRLSGGDERDRIQLGSFKLERGVSRSVTLSTTNMNLDLQVDPTTSSVIEPPKLEPLPKEGRKEWRLTITIKPNSVGAGDIPAGTAVVLTTKGANSRRIRIPIAGSALR